MVQNIPPHAIYGVQNGQEIISDNYRYNAQLKRMAQPLQQDTFTPQFTGAEYEAPKKKGVFGKLLTLAAAVGGAVLLKKNWNKVSQYVDDIIKKFKKGGKQATEEVSDKTIKQTKKAKARANKVQAEKTYKREQKTSVTTTYNRAKKEEITEEMIKEHRKALKGEPLTKEQKQALDRLNKANSEERAVKNSLAENSKGDSLALERSFCASEAKVAQAITDGAVRHANGNIYHVKDGVITKVELFQRNKAGELVKNSVELTDAAKISKHLAKQGVIMHDLIAKGSVKVAA